MFVLDLDDRLTAYHLASALDLWARKCREAEPRVPFPPGLDELRRRAWTRVTCDSKGQEGTSLPPLEGLAHTQSMRLWLTVEDVASLLSVSPRQAKRLMAEDALPSFKVGASRRVHIADVTDFAERRGGVNVTVHRIEGVEGAHSSPNETPAPAPTEAA